MTRNVKGVGVLTRSGRKILLGVATVSVPLLLMGASPNPAGASSGSVMNATEHLGLSPNGHWTWNANRGESVRMVCWTTGPYVDGGGKWFYVDVNGGNPNYRQGFVPANSVSNQTSVGHC